MPIRMGKLNRPCRRCNESFVPEGKYDWICPNCNPRGKTKEKIQRDKIIYHILYKEYKISKYNISKLFKKYNINLSKGGIDWVIKKREVKE